MRFQRPQTPEQWGGLLILLGVAAWGPYALLKYLLHVEVPVGPFLAAHLAGVLPGFVLRRGPAIWRWFRYPDQRVPWGPQQWGNFLLAFGLAIWIPFLALRVVFDRPVSVLPFLLLHLCVGTVGVLLREGPTLARWLAKRRASRVR
jgi:uncharacterized membrane protein YjjB (DUF3815 family)